MWESLEARLHQGIRLVHGRLIRPPPHLHGALVKISITRLIFGTLVVAVIFLLVAELVIFHVGR